MKLKKHLRTQKQTWPQHWCDEINELKVHVHTNKLSSVTWILHHISTPLLVHFFYHHVMMYYGVEILGKTHIIVLIMVGHFTKEKMIVING